MTVGTQTTQVVFIDASIAGLDPALASIAPGAARYLIAADRDALQQMAEVLGAYSGLQAVHVFSHGGPGRLALGASAITTQSLEAGAGQLAEIGRALQSGGDILLYGCEVGAGAAGADFVATLARLTGADVAASTDATGAAALGGNWQLEAASGAVETVALAPEIAGLLPDDYAGSTATTGTVTVGVSRTGTIETAFDADWFAVVLTAGTEYTFTLDAAALGGLQDPYLVLRNSVGTQLTYDDDGGGNLNSRFTYIPLSSGTYYLDAHAYSGGTGTYDLRVVGDTTAPTVASFSPLDEALSVAVGSNIVVTFNEAIQRGTGTIFLKTTAGTVIEQYDAATSSRITVSGSTLTLDPSANLANSTGYRVEFASGNVRDLAGNAYAGTSSYNFTTVAATTDDYAASSATTGSISVGGSRTGNIEVSLDRDWFAVTLVAGNDYTFQLDAAALSGLSDAYLTLYSASGTQLAYDDDGGVGLNSLITGYRALVGGTHYLEARGFGSSTGNYVLSVSGAVPSDTVAPTVSSFSPADEAGGVAVGSNVVVTFSEAIVRGTGTITLRTTGGVVVEQYDAATSSRITVAGSTLTLDPSANLASGTSYNVDFAAGTVRDAAGNAYAGTSSYNFSTAAGGDDYAASSATTGVLAIGGSTTGNIEISLDRDWFAVTLVAGTDYTFRLDAAASGGLGDPYLVLRNSAGTQLAYDDDSGVGLNSLLSYRAVTSGTHYLEARAFSSGTGAYVLTGSGSADTTAPTVSSFSPADEATGIAVGSNIVLTFSEAIQRGTGTVYLKTAAGTVVEQYDVATSSRITVSGTTLTLDPAVTLGNGTAYRVEFGATAVRDLAGNAWAGTTSYNFTTVGDTVAPLVQSFSPADEALSVAVGSNIVVTFNEAIQRGTGTIFLKTTAGTLIEQYDAATSSRITVSGSTLTLDPSASLANNTSYRVEFAAGNVLDLAGNAYAGTTAYNFITIAAAVVDDRPADATTTGSLSVGGNTTGRIEVANDRDWFAVTLVGNTDYTFRLNSAASEGLVDPYLVLRNAAGTQLAYNDDGGGSLNSLLAYRPASGGTYYLEARAFSTGTGNYVLSATGSSDVDAPSAISFSPADEATSVAVGSNVVVTFSEAIQRGVGTIYLKTTAGAVVEQYDAATSSRISVSGSMLIIDPTADLAGGTGYRVEFGAGTVKDLAGNSYVGTTSYNFTTAAGSDDYAATSLTTGSVSVGGSASGRIEVANDRDWFAVSLAGGTEYSFRLDAAASGGLGDPYLVLRDSAGAQLAYDDDSGPGLNSLLTYRPGSGGTYYVEARAFSSGTGNYTLTVTGTADTVAPTALSFSPADEAGAVATGSNVVVTFSEAIRLGTGTITLKTAAGAVVEQFNAATSTRLSVSGSTLTIDPTASLLNGTGYRVEFASGTIEDLAGNDWLGTTTYNFTTVAAPVSDDFTATTATTGAVAVGGSATGHIETANDRDWFAVALNAGTDYTFRLNGAASSGLGDPYLVVRDAGGTQLAFNDDFGGSLNSQVSYRPLANGTFYLEARAYSTGLGDYVLSASTDADVRAPVAVTYSPADEAGLVAVGSNIVITFDEAIQRGTGTIYLKTAAGSIVEQYDAASSSRVSIANRTLTLDPAADLAQGVAYRVEFASGTVKDLAGNPWAGTTSYNFTTLADSVAPTVVSFSPADEATSVAVGSNVVVTFSEAIQRGTGTIFLKTTGGTVIEQYDAATSSRITVSGSTLTLDPAADLAAGTAYRVEFGSGTVKDLAGNAYAGTTGYNFTTVAAAVSDDFAASSATTGSVGVGGTASGNIETANDRDWFAITLNGGTEYSFRLDAAASSGLRDPYLVLRDVAGTQLAYNDDGGGNLNSLLTYRPATGGNYYLEARAFSTGTGAYVLSASGPASGDVTAPTVTSFSPADEASGVAVGANIVVTFNEAIQRGTGTIFLKTTAGTVVEQYDAATSSRISLSGATLTLDPSANLANGTGYRVEFASGTVKDLAGNSYAGTTAYNFTTGADTVAPTVTSFSPADEASGVAVGSNIVVTFSEAIQRGTGTIFLKTTGGTVIEQYDAATSTRLTLSGATLTLDPAANLASGTGYRVEFGSGTVKDLAGNAYAGTTSYNFTTAAAAATDDYTAAAVGSGSVSVGGNTTGRIETANDRDWFAVTLAAGHDYSFRLDAAASGGLSDPYLVLRDAAGTQLAYDDDGGGNMNSLIAYRPSAAGTYYLEARAYGTGTGNYRLTASEVVPGAPGFTIEVAYSGNSAYENYFRDAAQRWSQIITGDLPDVNSSSGLIDDLRIDASVVAIDGPYNILGQATYTGLRGGAHGLPYSGYMQFDSADVAMMIADGTFGGVVLHEMGHVLGLSGSLWRTAGVLSNADSYLYVGANALEAYDSLTPATPTSVPLERNGGPGTAGSHWSEQVFDKELMTGYAENQPPMPISIITVGALEDLGYQVNYAAADPFTL